VYFTTIGKKIQELVKNIDICYIYIYNYYIIRLLYTYYGRNKGFLRHYAGTDEPTFESRIHLNGLSVDEKIYAIFEGRIENNRINADEALQILNKRLTRLSELQKTDTALLIYKF